MAWGVNITVSGPVVEGLAPGIVAAAVDDITKAVAQDALAEVQQNLDASIRNPTPYYETQITNDRAMQGYVIHDRGIVYGPWLEGTSTRNATTRFKGYASFRRARATVEARIPQTTDRVMDKLRRDLGGQ